MSCRATKGNSAVTSLARFQSGLDERAVSREFHAARRDAARRLGVDGKTPESAPTVLRFLAELRATVNNDEALKPRNRASLLQRISQAEVNIAAGHEIPNRETFAAWRALPDYTAAAQSATSRAAEVTTSNEVTAAEVAAAAVDVDTAKRQLAQSGSRRSRAIAAVRAAQQKHARLQAAYDTTRRGYADLRHQFRTVGAVDPGVAKRWRDANERLARDTHNRSRFTGETASSVDFGILARQARNARAEAVRAIAEHRAVGDADSERRAAAAYRRHKEARETYFVAIINRISLPPRRDPEAAYSMQAWADTRHGDLPRMELWAAAEYALAETDRRAERDGLLTASDVARAAHRRAAARQAVLDFEGNGEIETINASFGAGLRHKRQLQGRGGGNVDST